MSTPETDSTTNAPSEALTSLTTIAHDVARVEDLERKLDLLQREVLWPYFEPVERIRVTDQRAFDVQDIIRTLREASFGKQ